MTLGIGHLIHLRVLHRTAGGNRQIQTHNPGMQGYVSGSDTTSIASGIVSDNDRSGKLRCRLFYNIQNYILSLIYKNQHSGGG